MTRTNKRKENNQHADRDRIWLSLKPGLGAKVRALADKEKRPIVSQIAVMLEYYLDHND